MGQAFFTLSIGIGALSIFGSYIGKERALTGEAISVGLLDTTVAIVSGLIIFQHVLHLESIQEKVRDLYL